MTTPTTALFSTLSLWLFVAVAVANLGFCYATTAQWTNQTTHQTRCIPTEREALLEFKKYLEDPSNRLATWAAAADDDDDCCSWYGVSCHHHHDDSTAQYVTGLHLRSLSPSEFYDSDFEGDFDDYIKTLFGGKVSSALLSLKHLRYLDLSYNDFGGIRIPSFLGSMRSLRYLNLSNAGFGGVIPHQLGNLSNLQYLNLRNHGYFYYYPEAPVENLQWMSGLSSLKFLDLSGWNLSKVLNWDKEMLTTLPSLLQLHLSHCHLPSPQPHLLTNNINASSISILDLSGNYIAQHSAIFLSWVYGLKTLKSLNLMGNKLQGSIPRELQNMSLLTELYLGNNRFHTSIPNWLYGHTKLKVLSLSYNQLSSFQPQSSSSSVKNFSILSVLDLSHNNFQGSIPRELQNISSLREVYLDLNYFNTSIPNWLYGHTKLKVLSLSHNHLSSFQPQSSNSRVKNFSSLSVLDLSQNQFEGLIPDEIQNMTSLQKLDLSFNEFSSPIPDWLYGLTRLEHLDLSYNKLEGKISSAIGNMPSLISLVMSTKSGSKLELEGGIPNSFKNICNLRKLHLSGVKLRQDINQVFEILSLPGCVSNGLEELYLDDSQLFGNLATTNQHFGRLMSLKFLSLSGNSLNGTLPVSLGRLKKLEELYLNGNSLAGEVWEAHFENLKDLRSFGASRNQLKFRVSPNWIPPFGHLSILDLPSWHIGPQLPTWLRSLKSLRYLDLSSSGISSTIPFWFWNLSNVVYLNLSHNQIHGVLPSTLAQFFSSYSLMDMSSNRFHGPLPFVSSNLAALDLSNNSFSGSISKFLCPPNTHHSMPNSLQNLNLGQNRLYGEIPNCLVAFPYLVVINLSNNKLNGTIPESIGTLGSLEMLHLRNNSLSGELPLSLNKCTKLITIDVAENELVGNISSFVSARSLSGMKILTLHSNKLSGPIPEKLCHATSLHILDLANNLFDGTIPSCYGNLSAMTKMNESTGVIEPEEGWTYSFLTFLTYSYWIYLETALLLMKGNMLEYSTNLGFVRSLDLSNNKLCGKIPDEITSLCALLSLNLSHNALSGGIPKNIGFMKELESMDLSANQLSGKIPQSILSLTSLGQLNLSHNRLSGRIPSGQQIQTFDASNFAGNELCGDPLPNSCSVDGVIPNDANDEGGEDDDENGMIWFYVSMALGFVGGFWGFVGPLLLNRRWRFAYSLFLDRLGNRIWWRLYRFGMF